MCACGVLCDARRAACGGVTRGLRRRRDASRAMARLQRPLCALAALVLFCVGTVSGSESIIAGSREPCQNEGEEVSVPSIKDMSCFRCICKNGFVECRQEHCPSVDNCYMQLPRVGCCVRCKGCWYNGSEIASHTEWTDGVSVTRCEAGVLTSTRAQCYVPCANARHDPRRICPVCDDCTINGQRVKEGRDVTIPEDPCLKCRCEGGGLTCMKRACAVLPCAPQLQRTPPGECCPRCVEGKAAKLLPDIYSNKPCILGKTFQAHAARFNVDSCTTCICLNGTSVCERKTCPVVTCSPHLLLPPAPDKCCPRCPILDEVKTACVVSGKSYEDGQTWQLDPCKSCECHGGELRCAMERCPELICAPDQKLQNIPGQCCPKCVDSDGVCTVFGDPHYKTFDGKFYSYQGSCKYLLTSDCHNDTFSIRITNDARGTVYSSWTKTVALKIGETKINLGQKLRVKVNGQRIEFPFNNDLAEIVKANDSISVKTNIGINLLWDGIGFLEVTASSSYKKKLCGLCGNFNSIVRDDLTTRSGIIYKEPTKEDIRKFGNSWRVGGKKACTRIQEKPFKMKTCRRNKKKFATRMCKFFNKSEAFAGCRHKLNPQNYYEACLKDMCECPNNKCYCESYHAYAHECNRLGAMISDWKSKVYCGVNNTLPSPRDIFKRHPKGRSGMAKLLAGGNITRPPPGRVRPPPPVIE